MSEWQPIETAPRDGTAVDVWHKVGSRMTDVWYAEEDECWSNGFRDQDLTHWMPIPAPPPR